MILVKIIYYRLYENHSIENRLQLYLDNYSEYFRFGDDYCFIPHPTRNGVSIIVGAKDIYFDKFGKRIEFFNE